MINGNAASNTINVFQNSRGDESTDIKQEIRTLLEVVNPKIIPLIDAGTSPIRIMIDDLHAKKLFDLSSSANFAKYLAFQQTGQTVMASRNGQIGDYLNDVSGAPNMTGYALLPKDALKK